MKLPVWRPLYLLLHMLGYPVVWEVSVGAVVFCETSGVRRYLLLRYPSGHYDFARGHKEAGETEKQTMERETEEETGLRNLRVFEKRIRFRFFYEAQGAERERRFAEKRGIWIFKEVILFPAQTETEATQLSYEHTEFAWLPFAEAVEKATYPNAKKALRLTEKFLQNR